MKTKFKMAFVLCILVMSSFYLIAPKYPTIKKEASLKEVQNFVIKIAKMESRNNSLEALASSSKNISVELENAQKAYIKKVQNCQQDKECIINAYNSHMQEWTSSTLRKQTRAMYMVNNFGYIGDNINNALGGLY